MSASRASLMLMRICAGIQVVLGIGFWTGHWSQFVNAHRTIGMVYVLTLWIIALDGRFTPVVEFMYADFMWVAADQLFNQIAKARHMYGGSSGVPLVLRSKVAMGTGYGSQH